MYYLDLVKKTYVEAIALKQIPDDLRTALRSHERMPLMFVNLAKELEKAQNTLLRKGKKKADDKTIKTIIYDMIDIFIAGIEEEARKRYQSDLDKHAEEAKAQAVKDIKDTADGNVSGDFKDIFKEGGVIATDDRSVL